MAYDPESLRDQNDLIRLLQKAWEPDHPGDAARKDWQASLAVSAAHHLGFSTDELHIIRRIASLYPLWDQPLGDVFSSAYHERYGELPQEKGVIDLVRQSGLVPAEPPKPISDLILAVIDHVSVGLGGEAFADHAPEITQAIEESARLIQPLQARLNPLQGR